MVTRGSHTPVPGTCCIGIQPLGRHQYCSGLLLCNCLDLDDKKIYEYFYVNILHTWSFLAVTNPKIMKKLMDKETNSTVCIINIDLRCHHESRTGGTQPRGIGPTKATRAPGSVEDLK